MRTASVPPLSTAPAQDRPSEAARPAAGKGGAISASHAMNSRIERLCIEKGLKMTGQRRVIAQVLSEAGDHPDVEELYRRAVAQDSKMSIATVYRTVRLLEENGILERRDFGGGRARYEPTSPGPHHHLVDVDTGRVIEFTDPELEQAIRAIAGRLGFDLASHRLELFGHRRVDRPAEGAARKAQRRAAREEAAKSAPANGEDADQSQGGPAS
jgi:Fur family transcriptional regulator, ferric uptake regulator